MSSEMEHETGARARNSAGCRPVGRRASFAPLVLAMVASVVACGRGDEAPGAGTPPAEDGSVARGQPVVYVVNYPMAYLAERIGGGRVTVELPISPGLDPAFWSPGPEIVARYQQADLILLNGAGYAAWTTRATLPESRIVNASAGLEDRYLIEPGAITHSHGPEGEHSHEGIASTTWLDPLFLARQARTVTEGFAVRWPQGASDFQAGLESLEADLQALDAEQAEIVDGGADQPVLASHPVYQYLAARYGLNLRSVHFEPDEQPDEEAWRGLEELVKEHSAHWMLWEAESLPETKARLEEMGIGSVVYEPAGNRPEGRDYLSVMRSNLDALRIVYGS